MLGASGLGGVNLLDDGSGNDDQQLGAVFGHVLAAAQQGSDHGNAADVGQAPACRDLVGTQQAAEQEGLAVLEANYRLGAAVGEIQSYSEWWS